ncbi:MAG: hypothetical protein ACTSPQ_18915 [Candidatus Helarchaeota archaeon]
MLDALSISYIMNIIDRELFYQSLVKNDKLYAVHRWTRKIFKQGLDKCLDSIDDELAIFAKNINLEEKSI